MAELFDKYTVTKNEGPTDPDAQYFVLRLDTDHHARVAFAAYAQSIMAEDEDFGAELRHWLFSLNAAEIGEVEDE